MATTTNEAASAFSRTNKWYTEAINSDLIHMSSVKRVEYVTQSPFQDIEVVELGSFGKTLLLDSYIQSTESDEFAYHECLVHPVLLSHPNPKRVFIGGGGEGATAREVMRHNTVEECVMVDIDGIVVECCKKYFPKHHQGAYEDTRMKLIIDDAKKILEESADNSYDVIILDLADPLDGGPCYQLYTDEFYQMCKRKLTTDGILVTQSGPCGLHSFDELFAPIHSTVKSVFPGNTHAYSVHVPSFTDHYGFNMGCKTTSPKDLSVEEVDKRIATRIKGGADALKFYDGLCHQGVFALNKLIRNGLAKETRVISPNNFVFMTGENTQSAAQKQQQNH